MIRFLLLMAIVLTACGSEDAAAQNVCEGYNTIGPMGPVQVLPATDPRIALECLPEVFAPFLPEASRAIATGRGFGYVLKAGGVPVWLYCPRADGTWRLRFGMRTWVELRTQAGIFADKLASLTTLQDWHDTAIAFGWGDINSAEQKAIWCPEYPRMLADKPTGYPPGYTPPPPPAASWITSGTAAYDTAAGRLSAYVGSTTKGRTCDCTVQVKVGASTYCTFTGAAKPSIVAQCTKTTP